jgi:D-galactarolactone cycloisomerase
MRTRAQQPGTPQPEEGPVWRYERALETARELRRLGVFWLEEPLDRYDFEGLKRLCAEVDILIAGGENNIGLHELRWLIEHDVYDVIQPEAMVAETMSGLRKIAALGELHRKLVAPHSWRRRSGSRGTPPPCVRDPQFELFRDAARTAGHVRGRLPMVPARAIAC